MPWMPRGGLARLALVLATLAARPAIGARFLYATASGANPGRVDVFPLDSGGGVLPRQSTIGTSGVQPRRIIVDRRADGTSCTLYAAELDRVEAFRIGSSGDLRSIGATEVDAGFDPRDIAVGPDVAAPQFLYVPQIQPSRVVAYALVHDGSQRDGAPEEAFSSCVQGRPQTTYLAIRIENGLIYVSSVSPGRIEGFLPSATGITGKVCPEQNPDRLYQGPGTADALATELNPENVQCHPDPRTVEQFPVVDPSKSDKPVVSFLHVDPADTGTSTEEAIFLKCRRQCLESKPVGADCPPCPTGADVCQDNNDKACLTPRVYFTCPNRFLPGNCDSGSRTEDPSNRVSCPVTIRRVNGGAQDIALNGPLVFVTQNSANSTRLLSSIQLQSSGEFDPFICKVEPDATRAESPFCNTDSAIAALVNPQSGMRTQIGAVKNKKIKQAAAASQFNVGDTGNSPKLNSIYFDPDTQHIYAPQFNEGVVANYFIKDVDGVPKVRHVTGGDTKQDLRSAPFRVTVDGSVLYVAAGSFNRVQAFRLDGNGTPSATPFSWGDVPKGSFPNDVVVAVPGADCPD